MKNDKNNDKKSEKNDKNYRSQHCTGFTLVELLVTVAIAAILIGVAAPSFTNILENNRAQSVTDRLESSIRFARSEAVDGVENIHICPTIDGSLCSGANDWSQGWLIYDTGPNNTDDNNDAVGDDDVVIRVEDIGSFNATLLPVTNPGGVAVGAVCFNRFGRECNNQDVAFPAVVGGGASTLFLQGSGAAVGN